MGLRNFSMNDLTSASLPTLVQDLRDAIARGEYETIEQFAKDFAAVVPKQTLTAEGTGLRSTQVGEETVNFDGAVAQIVTELEALKDRATSNPAEAKKLIATYRSVDEQLTSLFKQQEMMQELAERGFDPEEFYRKNEEANKESESKAKRYAGIANSKRKEKTKVFGEDFRDPNPALTRKSLITKRDDEVAAGAYVKSMLELVSQMEQLSKANEELEAEIAANPSREATLRGNIDANNAQIATLTANLKGQRDKLADLQLPDFATQMDSMKDIEDRGKVTYADAKAKLEAIATNDYGMEVSYDPDGNITIDDTKVDKQKRINKAYEDMSKAMLKKGGIASNSPRGQAIAKLSDPSATPDEIATARKEVDAYVHEMEEVISVNEKGQRREETIIATRQAGVTRYKEMYDRMKTLSERFDRADVQRKDADGNPLFIHEPDESHPEPYVTTEDTGNPYMGTALKPKAATEREYLTDFDEAGKKARIEADGKTEMAGYTWSERRALLKEAGIGNGFTRFFRAMRGLDTSDTRLLAAATAERTAELQEQKAQHIESKRAAEAQEYIDLVDRVGVAGKDGADRDGALTQGYRTLNKSAVTHSGMQEGAYQVVDNGKEQSTYVDAMQDTSYQQLSMIIGEAVLTPAEKRKYEEAKKEYDHKEVARRNLEKPGRDIKTPNPKNPVVKDSGEER